MIDWLARRGYSLPTFPFYVDQSIGGIVSTGSHGSSIRWGSVSNLVKYVLIYVIIDFYTSKACATDIHVVTHRALKIVVSDGSMRTITEADGDVFKAACVSVGFLGVLVELTLKIVPDVVVKRELDFVDDGGLLEDLLIAQKDALKLEAVTYW